MTLLANATLVLPGEVLRGALHLKDGRIAAIEQGSHVPAGAEDCEGDLLMPGLIELHTDNLERHLQPRPKVDWPHQAAILAHDAELAGVGITTVFDALRVGSVITDNKTGYSEYARAVATGILDLRREGALRVSHFLHLRAEVCSETLVEEMAKFGPEDRIGIVSLMDHTPGQRQFRDIAKLRDYVMGKRGLSEADFQAHVANQQAMRARFGDLHEKIAVSEASRYGAALASHDDTTAEQVAVSKAHGVSFAEFPTTVEAAKACRAEGVQVMMGAPNVIRGGSHSGNVSAEELAGLDLLDILSSDYVPSSLLSAALHLGDLWGDMARGIATVTRAPAEATGLHDRGRLEIGTRADLLRVRRIGRHGGLRGVWVQGRRVG
ncbi:alpha-D-ribose 1-methylphosphonate 5-triphosphate diphosphatase [Falsigemmobacter faecalis]|uniref:Alpha-D-ribose 1-methylphosphonate 5-triphosphate diphosphatase n=1 Tax=Falsigemmobacter faecalis TaxID=2488730 RepID=A0A3P3DQZ1_9RHOB|nr:alpha-D-ribose 1-methylphosphonate 5-triphosphate diphosphatase [Falsigemmobacter faecalis]RRH76635.1 alpha-D-ribose 1-methylphosphonate 5-triphosphate diphosphatase [Falsigemmobacter faecalis]